MKRNVSSDISRSGFLHRMDWLLLILVTICAGASVVMLRALWTQNITAEVDSNDWIVQLISMALGIAGCISLIESTKVCVEYAVRKHYGTKK